MGTRSCGTDAPTGARAADDLAAALTQVLVHHPTDDPAAMVLARLTNHTLTTWTAPQSSTHLGLFAGGLSGCLLAAPEGALATALRRVVIRRSAAPSTTHDLAAGDAGIALALGPSASPQLITRLTNARLDNPGVAHGDPGIALALSHLGQRAPLRAVADRIVERARTTNGMVTWPGPKLQAWCYGTPGVAWALWEAGRTLADDELQRFAADAFESFLDTGAINPTRNRREGMAICHGDAGILLLCDAFARHAHMAEAAEHAELLADRLALHLAELPGWPPGTLLEGPAGVLAALLTFRSDNAADRWWLAALGLR